MKHVSRRRALLAVASVMAIGTTAIFGLASPGSAAPDRGSLIAVMPASPQQPPALSKDAADALASADSLSRNDPDNFGFPRVDAATGQVVLTVVSDTGRQRAGSLRANATIASNSRVESVRHSRAYLQKVMDGAIGPAPDGSVVYQTYPDPTSDRIVVEVDSASTAFLNGLAARYDPSAVVVRQVGRQLSAPSDNRQGDTSPFTGGAHILVTQGDCTSGFSWYSGSVNMMLTAGHCSPATGYVATNGAIAMGSVTGGSEESWDLSVGTVYMTGSTTYRGDVALVRLNSNVSSEGYIFRGNSSGSSHAPVKEMWSRRAQVGDQYCTGGSYSGEVCGWTVEHIGDYYYSGWGLTARSIVVGYKWGQCMIPGDSGGPVYTVRSDGGIAAKGIISGASGYGGSDHYAGSLETACINVFTDIWDAFYGLPGYLKLA